LYPEFIDATEFLPCRETAGAADAMIISFGFEFLFC
jgi:hypothetical protein